MDGPVEPARRKITLFDATGLAFQDLVAGSLAMKLARERGLGQRITLS